MTAWPRMIIAGIIGLVVGLFTGSPAAALIALFLVAIALGEI